MAAGNAYSESLRRSFMGANREGLLSRDGCSSELEWGIPSQSANRGFFHGFRDRVSAFFGEVKETSIKAYEMGRKDPRKVIFAAKMGLALSLVSLLVFFKEPLSYIGSKSVWAILTVVVVFEFSIGTHKILKFLSFVKENVITIHIDCRYFNQSSSDSSL